MKWENWSIKFSVNDQQTICPKYSPSIQADIVKVVKYKI